MNDETNVSAAPIAAPENNSASAPTAENSNPSPSQSSTGQGATVTSADDFDENIIPEGSRDNFRKYRESQKTKLTEYERKLNDETRKRMDYEARVTQFQAQQKNAQQPADLGEKPDFKTFGTIEEYRDALLKWGKQAGAKEFQETLTQQQTQQKEREAASKMAARGNAARMKYPDFDQITRPILAVANQIPTVVQFIKEFDNGTDVLYHLGKNPAALDALSKMQPFAAGQELLRIQAALSAPVQKAISQAPAPINPVNTGGDGNTKSVLELVKKENLDDYVARENRKELRKRKGAE